jgi:membrane protease YdiL (CAAX protease family)
MLIDEVGGHCEGTAEGVRHGTPFVGSQKLPRKSVAMCLSSRHSDARADHGELPPHSGPGLPESSLWAVGYLVVQALVAGALLLLLLVAAYGRLPDDTATTYALLLDLEIDTTFLLTGVTSLGAVFLLAIAARLRLGCTIRERLYIRTPARRDVLLAIGAVVPLAVVSNAFYRFAFDGWTALARHAPDLAVVDQSNTLLAIPFQAARVPYTILVVALALGPAVGEELVFRGVIGQGLVRRWGILPGVLLASLLFAVTHLFPPHALATLPLALFFHFAYLATRNFWVPVLLHSLNNALSLAIVKFPMVQDLPGSPVVLVFSTLYILVLGRLLWLGDAALRGEESGPAAGWLPLDCLGRVRARAAMAGSCILAFTTAFVWSVITMPAGAP